MPAKPWPSEDVERLKALWLTGNPASWMVIQLHGKYTRSGILGKAHRLNLPQRDNIACRVQQARRAKPKIVIPKISPDGKEAKDLGHPDNEPAPRGPIGDFPKAGCRWIHGAGQTFQCCALPQAGGTSWCEHHKARTMVKPYSPRVRP